MPVLRLNKENSKVTKKKVNELKPSAHFGGDYLHMDIYEMANAYLYLYCVESPLQIRKSSMILNM